MQQNDEMLSFVQVVKASSVIIQAGIIGIIGTVITDIF